MLTAQKMVDLHEICNCNNKTSQPVRLAKSQRKYMKNMRSLLAYLVF
jgi:hypothetical protein